MNIKLTAQSHICVSTLMSLCEHVLPQKSEFSSKAERGTRLLLTICNIISGKVAQPCNIQEIKQTMKQHKHTAL